MRVLLGMLGMDMLLVYMMISGAMEYAFYIFYIFLFPLLHYFGYFCCPFFYFNDSYILPIEPLNDFKVSFERFHSAFDAAFN